MKLHQILALHKTAGPAGEGVLTRVYHTITKKELLAGITKTYEPRTEDGAKLPGESTRLQLRIPVVLRDLLPALKRQMDLVATVDAGNQAARADVVVDGEVILSQVPVETLLFLEKKLDVLEKLVEKLPTLDDAEDWEDAGDGLSWKTKPSVKARTDKVPTRFVRAEATDKHPAQVEILYLDEPVGDWTTIRFSGAITAARKNELASKVATLLAAVKVARGEANSTEVTDQKIGDAIFEYLGW